jgi:hypothetical protein
VDRRKFLLSSWLHILWKIFAWNIKPSAFFIHRLPKSLKMSCRKSLAPKYRSSGFLTRFDCDFLCDSYARSPQMHQQLFCVFRHEDGMLHVIKYFSSPRGNCCFSLVQHWMEGGIRLRFWQTGTRHIAIELLSNFRFYVLERPDDDFLKVETCSLIIE